MSTNDAVRPFSAQWLVCPAGLPLIRRRCLRCPSSRYQAHGKFRVNANHKLLDVWLLALCVRCGETIKLSVLERVPVRTIDPSTLDRFHDNDIALAARLLADPVLLRRNSVALDWAEAWTVRTTRLERDWISAATPGVREIDVRFVERIPIRLTRLLSAGLEVPRAKVERLVADGRLTSAHPLTGKAAGDFRFTLHR